MDTKKRLEEKIEHQIHVFKNSHPGDRFVVRRQIIKLAVEYETVTGHKYATSTLCQKSYESKDNRSMFID